MYQYVRGAEAASAGNVATAETHLANLAAMEMQLNDLNWSEKAQDVMVLELRALIQNAQGNGDKAVKLLREAADIEFAMPRRFGPPWPPKPSHELLGEMLAGPGGPRGRRQQFRIALSLATKRSKSLLGLARANAALGQNEEARRAYAALIENWQRADGEFAALGEAGDFTGSGGN